jgi:hypothetical protein
MTRKAAALWFVRGGSGPFTSKTRGRTHCVLLRREQFTQARFFHNIKYAQLLPVCPSLAWKSC